VEDSKGYGWFDGARLVATKDRFLDIKWFARYGAAVLCQDAGSDGVNIKVVGLDGWDFDVHSSVNGRAKIARADVRSPAIFPHGLVKTNNVKSLWALFVSKLLTSEQENTADRRGQRSGHLGNQKTPSFLSHLLHKAASEVMKGEIELCGAIHGGTTDVGLHTGCIKRNTSFPLVVAVCPQHGNGYAQASSFV
jgi:hypothetical protein